ncbi:cohesin domain-containing protein [Desulfococcaceae bacterium HSG9]|nr:cohesin domain-containing protein [Desulfococcaceae bacterium HSG9]
MILNKLKAGALFILLTVVIAMPSQAADKAVLTFDNLTAKAGEKVTFTLTVNKAPNAVKTFGLEVLYDTDLLKYQSYKRGLLVKKGFSFFGVNESSPGTLKIGGVEPKKNEIKKGAAGSLVLLTFEVLKAGKGEIKPANLKDNIKKWPVQNGVFSCEKNKPVK